MQSKFEIKCTLLFSNFAGRKELNLKFDAPDPQKLRKIQKFPSKIEKKLNYAQLLCVRLF